MKYFTKCIITLGYNILIKNYNLTQIKTNSIVQKMDENSIVMWPGWTYEQVILVYPNDFKHLGK